MTQAPRAPADVPSFPAEGGLQQRGYRLTGTVVEIYDRLPSWALAGPGEGGGTSITSWFFDAGSIAGVAVGGMAAIVLTVDDPAGQGRRILLLEEEANPEQVRWLLDAFQGRLGGPLARSARGPLRETGFHQVPIKYRLEPERAVIVVPNMIRVLAFLGDPVPADAARPSGAGRWFVDGVGTESHAFVHLPDHAVERDLRACRALRGRFALEAR